MTLSQLYFVFSFIQLHVDQVLAKLRDMAAYKNFKFQASSTEDTNRKDVEVLIPEVIKLCIK